MNLKQFIHDHFDKLLLTFIFVGLVGLTTHLIHQTSLVVGGSDFVTWAENQSGTVLGALLMLITGGIKAAYDKSKETVNANSNGAVDPKVSDQKPEQIKDPGSVTN